MRILALDSSGLVASVAVVEDGAVDDQVIAEYTVNYKKTHSQTSLPMLDEIVKMTELDLHTVDAIAVAGGPGSFTGLRIGSATAKGLGLALEKPLIHIPTLEGLACNLCGIADVVCPIMDARRGQVYAGIYEFDGQKLHILEGQMAVPIEELGEKLKKYLKEGRRVTFLGDGVPVHKAKITEEILPGEAVTFAPANMNRQRAASVGTLGMQYYKEGKIETAMEHEPEYLRVSQAERERKERMEDLCECQDMDVHFLVGGTQTNTTVISAALRPYQGAVAAVSGHINVHETGAIEATGHKVLPLPSEDGKIAAAQVEEMCHAHWTDGSQEHMVQPGMVYISHPTENGTLYTKKELADLHEVCRKYGMLLFLDGARLGYGLMAETNDITLADLAKYTDVFYIGGTKVGALFGEAVVITNRALKKDFRYMIKQNGGMLAKGRLLGIQFDTLFTDDLYFKISAHADELAMKLKKIFLEKGYGLRYDSYTNQQFPILPDSHIEKLKEKYVFEFWEKVSDTESAVRFCTSWATKPEVVDELIRDIMAC